MHEPLRRLLDERLIVCVGSGGVGKTTTAAALALAGALHRRDAAVITVDPARRLKDSLGLVDLSTQPHRVAGVGPGLLDALALDTKRTFDTLIERVSPTPEIAERIFANRLYQELSGGLGGSAEYMAMEKLHELLQQSVYRLIVVDTPPSAHARDLLGAPMRLSELLASSAVRILKAPSSILGGRESGMARVALGLLLRTLERWTGIDLLRELADFAAAFEHLVEGFGERAREVEQALRRRGTSFVLVTTPEPETIAATVEFHRDLARERFRIAGIVVNRVHDFPPRDDWNLPDCPPALAHKLRASYGDFVALSRRDRQSLDLLRERTGADILAAVPVLEQPPASLAALREFAERLTRSAAWS